jgi:hypothetical protein
MTARPLGLTLLLAWAVSAWPFGPARAAYVTMIDNGPSANRVDVVFLGDGYTASQIDTTYVAHIQNMLDHVFGEDDDPFPRYKNFFNVHRVNVISNESGADIPPDGVFRDTALDAKYYCDGSMERLLCVSGSKARTALNDALAGAGFSAEMKLVTVNHDKYGGSGGSFAVYAGGNPNAAELALHELGHSFSGLADEYWSGDDTYTGGEPSQVNVTASPTGEKWAHWLDYSDPDHTELGTVGAYEGARYYRYGLYRPTNRSKMRSLNWPFNAVCREKIILDIYGHVDPLDDWLDNGQTLVDPQRLWVEVVDAEVIRVEWSVNGVPAVGAVGESFDPRALGLGSYSITAHAYDDTPWVRLETDLLDQSVSWSVLVSVPEPSTLVLAAIGAIGLWLGARRRLRIARLR